MPGGDGCGAASLDGADAGGVRLDALPGTPCIGGVTARLDEVAEAALTTTGPVSVLLGVLAADDDVEALPWDVPGDSADDELPVVGAAVLLALVPPDTVAPPAPPIARFGRRICVAGADV